MREYGSACWSAIAPATGTPRAFLTFPTAPSPTTCQAEHARVSVISYCGVQRCLRR